MGFFTYGFLWGFSDGSLYFWIGQKGIFNSKGIFFSIHGSGVDVWMTSSCDINQKKTFVVQCGLLSSCLLSKGGGISPPFAYGARSTTLSTAGKGHNYRTHLLAPSLLALSVSSTTTLLGIDTWRSNPIFAGSWWWRHGWRWHWREIPSVTLHLLAPWSSPTLPHNHSIVSCSLPVLFHHP